MRKVGAGTLAQLRAAPAVAILAAAPGLGFRPIVDGHVLPHPPAAIFAAGAQNDVPLMAGWNKDEGFNFTLLQGEGATRGFDAHLRDMFGARAAQAAAHYPSGSPARDAASARLLGGDLTIVHSAWAWIEAQKATGRAEIFRFQFDRAPLTPQGWFGARDSREAGAFHAGEILYVFDNLHAFPWLIDDADREVARRRRLLDQFRQERDPNGPGLPLWPDWRAAGNVMHIDGVSDARPATDGERHAFLAGIVAAR